MVDTAAIVENYNCSVLVEIEKNKLFLILESELDTDKRRRVHVLFLKKYKISKSRTVIEKI